VDVADRRTRQKEERERVLGDGTGGGDMLGEDESEIHVFVGCV